MNTALKEPQNKAPEKIPAQKAQSQKEENPLRLLRQWISHLWISPLNRLAEGVYKRTIINIS